MTFEELDSRLNEIVDECATNMLKLDGYEMGSPKPAKMNDLYYLGSEMFGAIMELKTAMLDYLKDK